LAHAVRLPAVVQSLYSVRQLGQSAKKWLAAYGNKGPGEGIKVRTETTITDDDQEMTGPAPAFHLVAMSTESFVTHPLPESGVMAIGRSSKCEVQLDDPLISREHARLHVTSEPSGPLLHIEDAGSANGTRVRDAVLRQGERAAIHLHEAVMVGSTVLMVMPNRATTVPQRLWSHVSFEGRLEELCAVAGSGGAGDAGFTVARVRFSGAAPWYKVLAVIAGELAARHVFAVYGPSDYEVLFVGVSESEAETEMQRLARACEAVGLSPRFGVASYPRHGRNADTLIAAANARLKAESSQPGSSKAAGLSDLAPMERVRQLATKVAASPINVLILGERGVGKDVLAKLIHQLSPRASRPFVALNCAAFSETMLESELFGHERGAFTGAVANKVGLLESAHGGTVFLDEIGDMPAAMQAKLLRAIENREVRPVGAVKSRTIDVRFISATNRDINAAIENGEFRGDLRDRLNTMTLEVPPLRERTDEIPALVSTFVAAASRDMGRAEPLAVGGEVTQHLLGYRWPGNIRELKNVIERAVALCDGPEIRLEHLPIEKLAPEPTSSPSASTDEMSATAASESSHLLRTLNDPARFAERQRIIDALAACSGNQTRAAALLNMSRRTLISKLDFYGLPRPQKGST
jgi:DNA-binding NtrC family response regulator